MMNEMSIEQALQELKQAKNDPQSLAVTTAKIACDQIHPQLFEILKVAAIPHWIDNEILAHLLQTDLTTSQQWLSLLQQLPMLESYAYRQGWNVHEATRLALRKTLAHADSSRFLDLTGSCINYFSERSQYQHIEHLYHSLASMNTGAAQKLLDFYNEASHLGHYAIQQALVLVLEELINSQLLDGVILARTLIVRASIRGSRIATSLAKKQARQALTLFQQAGDEEGAADAYQWLGSVLQTEGQIKAALEAYQAGKNILQRLTERHPENQKCIKDLSIIHHCIGRVMQAQGSLDKALASYQQQMDIMLSLTKLAPDNTEYLLSGT